MRGLSISASIFHAWFSVYLHSSEYVCATVALFYGLLFSLYLLQFFFSFCPELMTKIQKTHACIYLVSCDASERTFPLPSSSFPLTWC